MQSFCLRVSRGVAPSALVRIFVPAQRLLHNRRVEWIVARAVRHGYEFSADQPRENQIPGRTTAAVGPIFGCSSYRQIGKRVRPDHQPLAVFRDVAFLPRRVPPASHPKSPPHGGSFLRKEHVIVSPVAHWTYRPFYKQALSRAKISPVGKFRSWLRLTFVLK
jgi:hypothetical protein